MYTLLKQNWNKGCHWNKA